MWIPEPQSKEADHYNRDSDPTWITASDFVSLMSQRTSWAARPRRGAALFFWATFAGRGVLYETEQTDTCGPNDNVAMEDILDSGESISDSDILEFLVSPEMVQSHGSYLDTTALRRLSTLHFVTLYYVTDAFLYTNSRIRKFHHQF